MIFKGIVNYRFGSQLSDNSIKSTINFGELSEDKVAELYKLSKEGEVGIILCDVKLIEDMTNFINEIKKLNEK